MMACLFSVCFRELNYTLSRMQSCFDKCPLRKEWAHDRNRHAKNIFSVEITGHIDNFAKICYYYIQCCQMFLDLAVYLQKMLCQIDGAFLVYGAGS